MSDSDLVARYHAAAARLEAAYMGTIRAHDEVETAVDISRAVMRLRGFLPGEHFEQQMRAMETSYEASREMTEAVRDTLRVMAEIAGLPPYRR